MLRQTFKTTKYIALTAIAALCGIAHAQTGLTTIQDTLFKADGTRFSGTVTIHWNTFDAANIGAVVQQSRSIQILNGNLQVQLAPNAGAPAPANSYTVMYQSDGREQFTETWTVAPSATPLKVADVRTGMITSATPSTANQTPIVESSVLGLVADLAQRPVKGAGFGTGSVALINQNGQIETVVGNVGDCVYADGTTGTCGGPSPSFMDAESPGGLVDGTNATFTLASAPSGASLSLFRNGLYMKAGFDYNLSGSTVQFVSGAVPQPMDTLVANYRIDPDSNLANLALASSANKLAEVLCSSGGLTNTHSTLMSLGACDVSAASLKPGDRLEVRFTMAHTGTSSGFDFSLKWGSQTVINRHAGALDSAVAGQAESAITATGAQITVQSWGTTLAFLPDIISAPSQSGVRIDLLGALSVEGSDSIALTNYTVLRYPAN
jgi:hypothetical protein